MSDNRPNVYTEDGKTIWRASAIGNCLSSLAYEYMGVEPTAPPDWLQRSFEEGNQAEDELMTKLAAGGHWLTGEELKTAGYKVEDNDQIELEIEFGQHVVRCHPDGIVTRNGAHYVAEVKFVGDGLWYQLDDVSTVPRYSWQASIEMIGTGYPLLYGVGRKDPDTRELVDFKSKVYVEPPHSLADLRARIGKIVKIAKRVDAGGEVPHCEYKMHMCGLWHMHRDDDPLWKRDEIMLSGDDAAIFDELFEEIKEARHLENHAKSLKKAATNEYNKLVKKYDVEGGTRIGSPDHTVTHVTTTRTTTDWKQLCQDLKITDSDLEKYQRESTSSYPKIIPST